MDCSGLFWTVWVCSGLCWSVCSVRNYSGLCWSIWTVLVCSGLCWSVLVCLGQFGSILDCSSMFCSGLFQAVRVCLFWSILYCSGQKNYRPYGQDDLTIVFLVKFYNRMGHFWQNFKIIKDGWKCPHSARKFFSGQFIEFAGCGQNGGWGGKLS